MKICPFCNSELSEYSWCDKCLRTVYSPIEKKDETNDKPSDDSYDHPSDIFSDDFPDNFSGNFSNDFSDDFTNASPENAYTHQWEDISQKNHNANTPYGHVRKIISIYAVLVTVSISLFVLLGAIVAKNHVRDEQKNKKKPVQIDIQVPSVPVITPEEQQAIQESIVALVDEKKSEIDAIKNDIIIPPKHLDSYRDFREVMNEITPKEINDYGYRISYVYNAKDLNFPDVQCDKYHLNFNLEEARIITEDYPYVDVESRSDYEVICFHAEDQDTYSTSFSCTYYYPLQTNSSSYVYYDYDPCSHNLHEIKFISADLRPCSDLIYELLCSTSPEYTLSQEETIEWLNTLITDMIRENDSFGGRNYFYTDSHIRAYLIGNAANSNLVIEPQTKNQSTQDFMEQEHPLP